MPPVVLKTPTTDDDDEATSSSTVSSMSDIGYITQKLNALKTDLVYETKTHEVMYHSNYEGLDLDADPFILTRQALQDKIIHHQEKRLLVTAPPASGKSSMITLLVRRLKQAQKHVFVLKTAAPKDEKAQRSILRREFRCALYTAGVPGENLPFMSYSKLLDALLQSYDYVFIDDAQRWFTTSLMVDLIKGNESRARVVFFASLSPEASELPTPAISGRLLWSDFKLEETEQEEFHARVIEWATNARLGPARFAWLNEMLPVIKADTGGHVGLLRLYVQEMCEAWWKDAVIEGCSALQTALNRYYFGPIYHALVSKRAGFGAAHLDLPEVQIVLRKMFESDKPVEAPPPIGSENEAVSVEDKAKRTLLRAVVVVSVSDPRNPHRQLLEFATSVHRRYWFRVAYPSAITEDDFASHVHNDIDVWLRLVLRTFQSAALSNPSSHGNSGTLPLEWTFQHEFWRGASMLLPPSMRVAAEVSKVMTRSTVGRTRLDFWMNSSLNWAVELMRSPQSDPDSIKDHLDRFGKNGRYYGLDPSQWRVVDFRPPGCDLEQVAADATDGLIIVCCAPDFQRATVFFETHEPEEIIFQGKAVLS